MSSHSLVAIGGWCLVHLDKALVGGVTQRPSVPPLCIQRILGDGTAVGPTSAKLGAVLVGLDAREAVASGAHNYGLGKGFFWGWRVCKREANCH